MVLQLRGKLEKARIWLERSKADLKSAEILKNVVYADSVYHSQQAVEKAIKLEKFLKDEFGL